MDTQILINELRHLTDDGELSLFEETLYKEEIKQGKMGDLKKMVGERLSLEKITRNYKFRPIAQMLGLN